MHIEKISELRLEHEDAQLIQVIEIKSLLHFVVQCKDKNNGRMKLYSFVALMIRGDQTTPASDFGWPNISGHPSNEEIRLGMIR
jgi:hypothetical protein